MSYPRDMLDAAHRHSSRHRDELRRSAICGCFYCCETCAPAEIIFWCDDGDTAMCPTCDIDAIIGSASAYPVADEPFLKAMNQRWF